MRIAEGELDGVGPRVLVRELGGDATTNAVDVGCGVPVDEAVADDVDISGVVEVVV